MNTYPDTVKEFMEESIKDLHYFFENENFFITPEEGIKSYNEIVGPAAVKSWVETGEVCFDDENMTQLLVKIITNCAINSMKEIGLVDSIEDENGEEVMWLTNKGKELGNLINDSFDSDEMNQRLNKDLK